MSSTIVLPQGTYPIGTRTLGPAAIPSGITGFQLQLDGTSMTNTALQVTMNVDLSLDSGTTWASANPGPTTNPFPVEAQIQGGAKDKAGNPLATYFVSVNSIPSSSSTTRQLKATVTISGTSLTTQGTLVTVP